MIGNLETPALGTLREVQARLGGVLHKRPGLALALWGEAGVGKTHAAARILSELPCKSLRLHATTALGELTRMPRPKLADWAEESLCRVAEGCEPFAAGVVEALAALLAELAPVVVHVEDLHEASGRGLETYQKLAAMLPRLKGAALLVTSRTHPPEPFLTFRLEPLEEASSKALLEGEVSAPLPQAATDWIYRHARGNPLFTLEYLRHLARAGHLWNDGHSWRWREPPEDRMPLTVEALIERQLFEASSTEAARRALEARAILPPQVSRALWAEVAGLDEAELGAALQTLERQNLLRHGEFVHPLFREVRLGTLRPERKQALARRALEALRDDLQAAALYVDDAGLEPSQALELLKDAASKMKRDGNQAGHARLLAQAVKYAGEEAGALALQAAQLLRLVDQKKALELAEQAADGLHSPEALYLLAELLAVQGRMAEVEQVLAKLPTEERAGSGWPARLLVLKALVGDFSGAVEVWRNHPPLQATHDPEVLYQTSFAHSATGDSKTGLTLAERALSLPGLTLEERSKLLSALGGAYYYRADYIQANRFQAEAQRLAREGGSPKAVAHIAFNRSYTLGLLGQFGEMGECLEEARQRFREIGEVKRYAHAGVTLSQLHVLAANYPQAEEILLESRAILSRMDPSESFVDCEKNLSQLYWSWRPPHGKALALKHAHSALQTARLLKSPRNLMSALVHAAYAETWHAQALHGLEMAEEAMAIAEKLGHPWGKMFAIGGKADALKTLGRIEEARQVYAQAQALAQTLHLELEAQTYGVELDRIGDDIVRAAQRLRWFKEMGAEHHVRLTRRLFPELAEAAPSVQPQPKLEGIGVAGRAVRRLEMLGPVQFTGEPLRGRKRQELMALLLEARVAGRSAVSKLELLEALYPGEDEEKAASSLKELVRTVRSALGAAAISTTSAGYALGEEITSDVEAFLREGDLRLWRGAYLEGLNSSNETVRDSVHLALRSRAQAALGTDPKEATRAGRILLEAEPYDLEVLRLTLEALRRSGNHKSLSRVYEEAKARMLEVGERLPTFWQAFLLGEESAVWQRSLPGK